MSEFDLAAWTTMLGQIPADQFPEAMQALFAEKRLRDAQPLVTAREDEIARDYHEANPSEVDTVTGFPVWVQPAGAHDAWPIGATVAHGGKVWDNIARVPNVWEPGSDGPVPTWRPRQQEPESPAEGPAEWETGIDYKPGDHITYNGVEYEILQAHTSAGHWPPDQVASLYKQL